MYLSENVFLYGEQEGETDESTFCLDGRLIYIFLPLARYGQIKWTLFSDPSDISSHKNLT